MVKMVKRTNRCLTENDREGPSLGWIGRKDGSEEVTFQLICEEWRKGGTGEVFWLRGGQ